jgi:hypothetical protein
MKNVDVKSVGITVDKTVILILHQLQKRIYPQIHIPNSNRLLNKKGINNKYYGRY